ncbi:MAG TPA: hypothetical protein PKC22_11595 [Rhodocyclaceae bacterium]|nr:hypothetical protein [Rhodocyclaceae bacterium]
MSLQTLRDIRLQRLRPPQVELVTMSCPRPNWRWLLEDPAIVWLPAGSDVRAHDLRPLVGLPVTALVDDLERRRSEVGEAVAAVGGVLIGIADGERAEVLDAHPWAQYADVFDGDWRIQVAPVLVSDRNRFWRM